MDVNSDQKLQDPVTRVDGASQAELANIKSTSATIVDGKTNTQSDRSTSDKLIDTKENLVQECQNFRPRETNGGNIESTVGANSSIKRSAFKNMFSNTFHAKECIRKSSSLFFVLLNERNKNGSANEDQYSSEKSNSSTLLMLK